MSSITPKDLQDAFLAGVTVGYIHYNTDTDLLAPPSMHVDVGWDATLDTDGLWAAVAKARFPEQPIRVPKRLEYAGFEYGWVGAALYSRRSIDPDVEPRLISQLPTNPDLLAQLVKVMGQNELVAHTPENVLWANLI
jgi:hypothetical protein